MFNRSKIKELEYRLKLQREHLNFLETAMYEERKRNVFGKYFKCEKIIEDFGTFGCGILVTKAREENYYHVTTLRGIKTCEGNVITLKYLLLDNKEFEKTPRIGFNENVEFDYSNLVTEITKEEYEKVLKEAVKQKYNI